MTRAEANKISVGDTLKMIKSPANSTRRPDGLWLGAGREFEVAHISDVGYGPRFHAVEPGKKYSSSYSYVTPSEVELVLPGSQVNNLVTLEVYKISQKCLYLYCSIGNDVL